MVRRKINKVKRVGLLKIKGLYDDPDTYGCSFNLFV